MSVTPTLSSGVLGIAFSAANDAASLNVVGPNIQISDGTTTTQYAIGNVSSINLTGTPAIGQRFTINSGLNLPGTFTSLAIESITFGNNITFGARSTIVSHALAITGAETITVNAGATLFTQATSGNLLDGQSTANSGGLNFDAKTISVGTGARILTHGDSGFQGGDITLTAKYKQNDLFLTPLFNERQANVSLDIGKDAVLIGRNLTLATDADMS